MGRVTLMLEDAHEFVSKLTQSASTWVYSAEHARPVEGATVVCAWALTVRRSAQGNAGW